MFCRVIIGRVISKIVISFFPVDVKLILLMSITNAIKSPVSGFVSTLDDGFGDDASDTFVVELNWSWSLFVAHLM